VYDFGVGEHFTLEARPLRRANLHDFEDVYQADKPHKPHSERVATARFQPGTIDELLKGTRSISTSHGSRTRRLKTATVCYPQQ
jgi:hypothetical protein